MLNRQTIEDELERLRREEDRLKQRRETLSALLALYSAARPRATVKKRRAKVHKAADVLPLVVKAITAGYTRLREIRSQLYKHGVRLDNHAVGNQLQRGVNDGKLVRLQRGRYGLPNGDNKTKRKPHLREGFVALDETRETIVKLARGGSRVGPLIAALVKQFGLSDAAARTHVEQACRDGAIKRLGRGVYADPQREVAA